MKKEAGQLLIAVAMAAALLYMYHEFLLRMETELREYRKRTEDMILDLYPKPKETTE